MNAGCEKRVFGIKAEIFEWQYGHGIGQNFSLRLFGDNPEILFGGSKFQAVQDPRNRKHHETDQNVFNTPPSGRSGRSCRSAVTHHPVGREFKCPCEDHGDGKPRPKQDDNNRIEPSRQLEWLTHDIDDLDDQPGRHRVDRGNLKYLAPFDFPH